MNIAKFQFEIVAKDELFLPQYKGSTFRGSFGHALKKTVCVTSKLVCTDCLLKESCAYAYIFDTENERGEQVSHPFIIEPPMTEKRIFPKGENLFFNLILLGDAIDYLPYLVYAFKRVGNYGIGKGRGKYWIKEITYGDNGTKKKIYEDTSQKLDSNFSPINYYQIKAEKAKKIKIHFQTPTALKVNGKLTLDVDAEVIIKSIIRRLKSLSHYHNGREDSFFDFDWSLLDKVKITEKNLEWYRWQRYSGRQDAKIRFEGFVGDIMIEGPLTKLTPWLRLGEMVHIGRGTVYGMGKYIVDIIKK